MKNENGSPIWFFAAKKNERTKIKFVFHFLTIENRLALRYTDFIALSFWFKSSLIEFLSQISV